MSKTEHHWDQLVFGCNTQDNKINKCTLGLQVMLIVEHYCDCEMWNSNKSAVHLLYFLSKCNVR